MTGEDGEPPVVPSGIPPGSRSPDPWPDLRRATPARIGLGRSGDAMPLPSVLQFQFDHARARDAVHAALDTAAITAALLPRPAIVVRSDAEDRMTYLKRPDRGRMLAADCVSSLEREATRPFDCVFVIADGLSALAATRHAIKLFDCCLPLLGPLSIAPVVVATQARVALGDAVGAALNAKLCVMLIGERPGLSVADSLGVYITYAPRPGRRDSERNCISNIHANGGLSYEHAAHKLSWLIIEALRRETTGVMLKDDAPAVSLIP